MNAENNSRDLLNELSDEINKLYGYVKIAGDNFGEPAVNSGPCGAFANAFFKRWNLKFTEKVNIVFIMVKKSDECWHVLIRLPNGLLYDGGVGVHSEEKYSGKFDIEDMIEYDIDLLEKRSCGLAREYPRYCPSFSISTVEDLIEKYLNLIDKNITFEQITPEYPLLGSVISSSIGSPTPEKIAQVLQNYQQPNQFLIGAFSTKNLIAVIGFQLNDTQVTIKHISVLNEFKMQGIGKSLVHNLIKDYKPRTVSLETDSEAVEFYEKLGFTCQVLNGEHVSRYRCYLDLLPSQVGAGNEDTTCK